MDGQKYSTQVDGFLRFLRDAEAGLAIASSTEQKMNDKTQDILHSLELDDHGYRDFAKLGKAARSVRVERRQAKDRRESLQYVENWIKENEKAIRGLERLLGDLRKIERSIENRHYNFKTNIVEETIGKEEHEAAKTTNKGSETLCVGALSQCQGLVSIGGDGVSLQNNQQGNRDNEDHRQVPKEAAGET